MWEWKVYNKKQPEKLKWKMHVIQRGLSYMEEVSQLLALQVKLMLVTFQANVSNFQVIRKVTI